MINENISLKNQIKMLEEFIKAGQRKSPVPHKCEEPQEREIFRPASIAFGRTYKGPSPDEVLRNAREKDARFSRNRLKSPHVRKVIS